jgi:hypothetical protein
MKIETGGQRDKRRKREMDRETIGEREMDIETDGRERR